MIDSKTQGISATVAEIETTRVRGDERLEYILYRDEMCGRSSYSIQAIQYKKGEKICQATACDVSGDPDAAKEMFRTVSDGFVEPYVLCDVIYDLLP